MYGIPSGNQIGERAKSVWILTVYDKGAIDLLAGIVNFVVRSVFDRLFYRPDPNEIVGKVGDNQVFVRWRKGPASAGFLFAILDMYL